MKKTTCFILVAFLLFPSSVFAGIRINNPYGEVNFERFGRYKSNLHTHTSESDGEFDPGKVISLYSGNNYAVLAIADHDVCGPGGNWGNMQPETTWPWTDWIDNEASVINIREGIQRSAFFSDLGQDGVLAVRGNELSEHHHTGSYFSDLGYIFNPSIDEHDYFSDIEDSGGLAMFFHPGRYDYPPFWYNSFIDTYREAIFGIEVYNMGDRYPGDRAFWDAVNRSREPGDLIWGFSNDDMHTSEHLFRNYNIHFLPEVTEESLIDNLKTGALTFSFEPGGSGDALAPKLDRVTVDGTNITLSASGYDSIYWYDSATAVIHEGSTIDVRETDSVFVRAVLQNSSGRTYTQPFGIESGRSPILENHYFGYGKGHGTYMDPETVAIDGWMFWGGGWWAESGSGDPAAYKGSHMIKRWEPGTGIFQDFSAQAGQVYSLSLRAIDNEEEPMNKYSSLVLCVEWFDHNEEMIGSKVEIDSLRGGGDLDLWVSLSGTASAPQGVSYGRFLVVTQEEGDDLWEGAVYYDNASVLLR